ncbi:SDR family NAD(P)-dependent oxidoreductase [Nocardioides sp. GY 10113]|uniref:SDR family NAD(P)-dependent oxidoreductase n=1 Tax=Nocardioides sp. GY 10113 TaxID=2569761 RepID=UPI0010A781C0|nr:SDR family NAD(P)-dependent oxidoreductase [Nocardioides sp. GY 10113]TIC87328.1 SDR family NAD(P)-dependent oxidoreductase [Nocardioides sp. GY 10113]
MDVRSGSAATREENPMVHHAVTRLDGATVLITGANRGLGAELARAARQRGADLVIGASRKAPADSGTEWVELNLDDDASIDHAARQAGAVDLLVNNAGLCVADWLTDGTLLHRHLRTNVEGPRRLTDLMLPGLRARGGAVVNVLSLASIYPIPGMASYSASKSAAMSWTQTLAIRERARVAVHAVYAGPMDTDMVRDLAIPKSPPGDVAAAVLDAVDDGVLDIFPDAMSASFADAWLQGPAVGLQRANAAMAEAR